MKFQLKDRVRIKIGLDGEAVVIGRAEYVGSEPKYLLRYQDSTGRAVEVWWPEDAIGLASR